jgi:flagellar basal body P-ring formation protein FlgA
MSLRFMCVSLACAAPLAAQDRLEDLGALDARVASLVGATATPTPIDRRLKLTKCPEPVLVEPTVVGSVTLRCPAAGWRLRVAVMEMENPELRSVPIIRRGAPVDLIFEGQGFAVSRAGTALDNGAVGQIIRVKTMASAAPVSAIVGSDGKARLMP